MTPSSTESSFAVAIHDVKDALGVFCDIIVARILAGAIVKVASGNDIDIEALAEIHRIVGRGMTGRVFALYWITFRLKPFSPFYLVVHSLRNRLALKCDRGRITDWIRRMDNASREMIAAVGTGANPILIGARDEHADLRAH